MRLEMNYMIDTGSFHSKTKKDSEEGLAMKPETKV